MFAVVYRNATDMIFKIQLRKLSGATDIEMEGKKQKKSSIAYLMDPDIALTRGNVFIGRNATTGLISQQSSLHSGRDVNMSERQMLDGQPSLRYDDLNQNSSALPSISPNGRRGRLDFEFGDDSDNYTGDEDGNDQIEEIYRQQMEAAKVASLGTAPPESASEINGRRNQGGRRSQSSNQQQRKRTRQNSDALKLIPAERIIDDEDEKGDDRFDPGPGDKELVNPDNEC